MSDTVTKKLWTLPPFDRLRNIHCLSSDRSGHASIEHVRHQLYVARDPQSRTDVLVKLASRPGLIYQRNLANEIATLTTINRELRDARYFPHVHTHGSLRDGRVYLIMSLFAELPLAATLPAEHVPARTVGSLLTAIETARALGALHGIGIVHVDLTPMNILHRAERGRPVIRIVDFESSFEVARHTAGEVYNPSTTPGYSAPELPRVAPDARADVYSLGAVLYTMLAGSGWTWDSDVGAAVEQNEDLDADLKDILRAAVAPDPARRHPSMSVFREALAAHLERIWPGRSW
jgi:serine/threonine protein kinase